MKKVNKSKTSLQTFRLSKLERMEIEFVSAKEGMSKSAYIRSKVFK